MTSGQFQEVDFDLLADYVGGALDGTPDHAEVARLVATAPRWRDAHEALLRAMDPVRDALASWGAEQPVMPDEVAGRITAALAAASLDATTADATTADATTVDATTLDTAAEVSPASSAPGHVVPGGRVSVENADAGSDGASRSDRGAPTRPAHGSSGPGRDRPAGAGGRPAGHSDRASGSDRGPRSDQGFPTTRRRRRRRRLPRATAPVAVAAAVVALGLLGLSWLPDGSGQSDTGNSSAAGGGRPATLPERAAEGANAPRVLLDAAPERLLASGTDYTPASLPGAVTALYQGAGAPKESHEAATDSSGGDRTGRTSAATAPVPAALARLAEPTSLSTCLAAVTGEHGRGQVTVQAVDYASFEGIPALIVVFTETTGARWAWVSGADCGLPGSAADTRHRVRVG